MTGYVTSWFQRADEDLTATQILLEKGGSPNLACFHAQQGGEKYLKGFLAYHEKHTRKVHDLLILLEECKKIDLSFGGLGDDTRYLTQFYIESRYPDDYIKFSREEAQQAFEAAQRIKDFVLQVIEKKN